MSTADQSLNLNGKSLAEIDLDEQEEIVVALMEQGFLATQAKAAVASTFVIGDPFSDNFRRALNSMAQHRSSGRLNFQSFNSVPKVSSRIPSASARKRTGGAATPPASLKVLAGPPKKPASGAEIRSEDRAHNPTPAAASAPKPPCPKESPMKLSDEERAKRKRCPGCDKPLRKDNTVGMCLPCIREGKTPPTPRNHRRSSEPAGESAAAQGPAASPHIELHLNGHLNAREHNLVLVNGQISELQLDRLWTSMSAQEKAALLFPAQKAEA